MNRYKYIDEGRKHLHTLDGKPLVGTSTAMKIIGGDKTGGLIWWASGMAVGKFGWINPKKFSSETVEVKLQAGFSKVQDLNFQGYTDLIAEAYKAHDTHKKERAKIGTARHEILEDYIKLCLRENKGKPLIAETEKDAEVKRFTIWSMENVKKFLFSEIYCYSERLWVGGIADWGAELNDGGIALGDFKSSKEAYADQFYQCAGYAIQIEENGGFTKDGEKILEPMKFDRYLIVPFGAEDITPVSLYDTQTAKEGAELAVGLHKKIEATNQLLSK